MDDWNQVKNKDKNEDKNEDKEKGGYIMWNQLLFRMRYGFLKQEDGITTVELILVLVVLIAVVLIFKDKITELVNDIFETITSSAGDV